MIRHLTAIAGLLLLTACVGGGNSAAQRYSLTPQGSASSCTAGSSLKVLEPSPAPGLDTARMVVVDAPHHRTHYRGVGWTTTAPRLVQYYLADSLDRSGLFAHVMTDDSVIPSDYQLELELQEFQVDLTTGTPRVMIRLDATLLRSSNYQPLRTMPLQREVSAAGQDLQGIVAIFNEQMHSITQELFDRMGSAIPACRR